QAGVVGVLEVRADVAVSRHSQALVRNILNVFRNFESLLDYSERDTLTGLLNRKTFDETFFKVSHPGSGKTAALDPAAAAQMAAADMAQAADSTAPLTPVEERRSHPSPVYWLALVDIDHFKTVNDRFGHLIGDEVLLLLARIMRSTFRLSDRMYRFGGEEFLVLLPAESRAHATLALERFRTRVEAYRFPQVGTVTISLGFTRVRAGDTPGGAFERADKAVYFSKENGRNRLTSHEDLVERGVVTVLAREDDIEMF
ncbi:MAG: Diguanylate cyclase protein, partial [Rhizobacter sp.]|nr:Diguanylate cyclase protein [Rhizobacter sp.]